MITDGPANLSLAFRTVRIGTMKAYALGKNDPMKFNKKRLKFAVKFRQEGSAEVVKIIIPSKYITGMKSFLGRGCPVIWLQTTQECTKNLRRMVGMRKGLMPSSYYDPESNVKAERMIGIVVDMDPIPYTDSYMFKKIIQAIFQEKNIEEDDFHNHISHAICNAMLVEVSATSDRIASFSKKAVATPGFDIRKNMYEDLKGSSSLLPERPPPSSKETTETIFGVSNAPAISSEDTSRVIDSSMTDEQSSSMTAVALRETIGPQPAQRNRARKSIPKSNRTVSLESQLNEIRAKAKLNSDMEDIQIINIDDMRVASTPVSSSSNFQQDVASDSAPVVKKKRPKDPFHHIWKDKTRRNRTPSVEQRLVYRQLGTTSPMVGQPLQTPFSTISASTPSNSTASGVQQPEIVDDIESAKLMAERYLAVEKCKCLEKSPHIVLTGIDPIKCMGLDSVDGRLSKCYESIQTPMMMRPSCHSPSLALCEEHRERMLRHECCPGCGMFCAGGTYLICMQMPECPHRFHKDCLLLHHQTKNCLHCCGPMSRFREVTVEPRQEYKLRWVVAGFDPNKMEKKRLTSGWQKTSRMGHKSSHCTISNDLGVIRTLRPGIAVDTSSLPQDEYREMLEEALCSFFEASHERLKIHPKNVSQVIQQGDLMKLIQFLHEAEDHDVRNLLKNPSTLNKAVVNSRIAIAYLLIIVGVELNAKDVKGKTALFYAEESENVRLINCLIKSGADITLKDSEGMTCMHHAAKQGRIVSCATLLSRDADIINFPDEGGWTPIVWATEHEHTTTAKYLEHFGADVAKTDKEKNSCLHWAALSGNLDLIIMCLQRHSDVNFKNMHGDTALHIAARQDHTECVLCLANWGADLTVRNNEGKTAMECTFPNTDSEALLKFKYKVADIICQSAQQQSAVKDRLLSADLSKGFENLPVTCLNSVDDALCPTEAPDGFHYVTANVHMSGDTIVKNPTNKMQSCYCYNECSDGSCLCGVMSSRCWYNKKGQLIPEFDFVDAPYIVECSETCWCPPSCHNRVVQKGIRYNLQVHRTRGMGWSVRTLDTIPWGAFVCEYVGELISDAEADIREDDSYLFDLENSDGEIFCIDARYYGNVSRFINHLCDPNLMPLRVFIDHHDKRFPRLAYFSTRQIKAGEELGFDYGNRFWDVKCRSFTCGCGSPQCKYSKEAYRLRKEQQGKEIDSSMYL